jgi:hypothetical protein
MKEKDEKENSKYSPAEYLMDFQKEKKSGTKKEKILY